MEAWPAAAIAAAAAYLLGSTPTGYLAGRLLKGVDLRGQGSGSTGATNVLRTLGPWPALAVLFVDLAKGAAGLGVLLAMSWPVGLGAAAAFVASVALTRIVSLSSMLAALAATALVLGLEHPLAYRLLAAAGAAFVIWLHRANIGRLLTGTEPRVSFRRP